MVEGIEARRNFMASLTMAAQLQHLLFPIALPAEGKHLFDKIAAPESGLFDPLEVVLLAALLERSPFPPFR